MMAGHGWMYGWAWGGMLVFGWLLTVALVGLTIWAITRGSWGRRRPSHALDLLDERFARGELSPEEYRERRTTLQDQR